MTEVAQKNLVIVSYYDARPIDTLIQLLDQIASHDAGAPFDLIVSVNSVSNTTPTLPDRHSNIKTLVRENRGFNVGAWQHAWKSAPQYPYFLFLQDECTIERDGWLEAFVKTAQSANTGFVGECMNHCGSWEACEKLYPATYKACLKIAEDHQISLGETADHLQTLAVGACATTLEKTGGFVEADDKVGAMAGEILSSVRATSMGLQNRQVAWRPFEYVGHPQWIALREKSNTLKWSISRALHLWAPKSLNRMIPRNP